MESLCRSGCRSRGLLFLLLCLSYSPHTYALTCLALEHVEPLSKSTLKMNWREERLPCRRLVAEVAADPTPEQEFYGSSIPMEQSHAPTMASLLAKAKAAKQAKIERSAEARQRHLDAHKRRAQGLRAKEAQEYAVIEAEQYRQRHLDAHERRAQGLRAKEAQQYTAIEAQQYEPMVIG
jgi:hypothetical protein